jgi:hypothetical protein
MCVPEKDVVGVKVKSGERGTPFGEHYGLIRGKVPLQRVWFRLTCGRGERFRKGGGQAVGTSQGGGHKAKVSWLGRPLDWAGSVDFMAFFVRCSGCDSRGRFGGCAWALGHGWMRRSASSSECVRFVWIHARSNRTSHRVEAVLVEPASLSCPRGIESWRKPLPASSMHTADVASKGAGVVLSPRQPCFIY